MTDQPLQLTLREVRADVTKPKGVLALTGVGVLLGLSGPFQTYDLIPLLPRILYWVAVTFVTYAVGALINIYLNLRFADRLGPFPVKVLINGVLTGAGVMVAVTAINAVAFGWPFHGLQDVVQSWAVITLVSTIITGMLMVFSPVIYREETTGPPALLDRLPLDKRGALMAIAVEDHYVHVTTTKGREMILMRLSDAIKETAPAPGLQVHRSHWVALDQIAAAKRIGDRAVLTLHNGAEVPASRSYIPALRDAGVFPKAAND